MGLRTELRQFLNSVKVSEALSAELRDEISIETGLEDLIRQTLIDGRNVLIAGSAGGGKTHLLDRIRISTPGDHGTEFVEWPGSEPNDRPFIRVVSDATTIDQAVLANIFEDLPGNCKAVAVAINEGPLLALSRTHPTSVFRDAVTVLHKAQEGIITTADSRDAPVVVDIGSFDPVGAEAISKIIELPILSQLVENSDCTCETDRVCPRRFSWRQLRNGTIRRRLNETLEVVNLHGQPVLFRELWDFVADISLGGDCSTSHPDRPYPTSPWFWRVFYGDSDLSRRLRSVASPELVVHPHVEAHAYYGDWVELRKHVEDGVAVLPLPSDCDYSYGDQFRWLKSQLFFVLTRNTTHEVIRDQIDLQLKKIVDEGRVPELIGVLNNYMSYGTRVRENQFLQLWTDLALERRMDRPRGQVSLGSVSADEFVIRRSLVVANPPDNMVPLYGSRFFLVHEPSNASFNLSSEALNLLVGGRSHRTSDRPHTDMEWFISRFYGEIAQAAKYPSKLEVMRLDFRTRKSAISTYNISLSRKELEMIE